MANVADRYHQHRLTVCTSCRHRGQVDALVAFARQYGRLTDGWTRSPERLTVLAGKTLARIPAMMAAAGVPDHA